MVKNGKNGIKNGKNGKELGDFEKEENWIMEETDGREG